MAGNRNRPSTVFDAMRYLRGLVPSRPESLPTYVENELDRIATSLEVIAQFLETNITITDPSVDG